MNENLLSQKGTKKVLWQDVKNTVKKINNELFQLIEPIKSKDDLPLYIASFGWGELIGDEKSQFIPQKDGSMLKLSHDELTDDIQQNLGYGICNSPVGMIFQNDFEWFVDLPEKEVTLPYKIYKPGDFFAYTKILGMQNDINYAPMGIFKGIAGTRSCFMLPPISYKKKLDKMFKYLKIRGKQPSQLYDHFSLFKTILKSSEINNDWSASILYFSENWINNIKNNQDWIEVKNYFFRLKSKSSSYRFNAPIYNTAYSLTLEKNNQKPNPYLFDTFKHLIDIASGDIPGMSPQVDESLMPVEIIQKAFIELYGIDYTPTLMAPKHFSLLSPPSSPCYYSMNFPTTFSFSPSSAKLTNAAAIKELIDIYQDIKSVLSSKNSFCSNTIIQYIFNNTNISFHHSSNVEDEFINSIDNIIQSDSGFSHTKHDELYPNIDAPFFKGCIQIK